MAKTLHLINSQSTFDADVMALLESIQNPAVDETDQLPRKHRKKRDRLLR
jgi:hypothetical protein